MRPLASWPELASCTRFVLAGASRDPAAESPVPFVSTPSTSARPDTLNSIPAKAYRRSMPRLINQLSPNPRLQRTRSAPLRSPLSRKSFGASAFGRWR